MHDIKIAVKKEYDLDELENSIYLKLSLYKHLPMDATDDFVYFCCLQAYDIEDTLKILIEYYKGLSSRAD